MSPVAEESDIAHRERVVSASAATPQSGLEEVLKQLSALKAKVKERETNLGDWEIELKARQNRLSEAWKAIGASPALIGNPPLRDIDARLNGFQTPDSQNRYSRAVEEEENIELRAIKATISALDVAESKLRAWEDLLKEDEDRCISAASALSATDEGEDKTTQSTPPRLKDDGICLVTPLPDSRRDYRRQVKFGLLGQQMRNSQRIPRGMSLTCIFAQTVDAGKLERGSKFYLLLASGSDTPAGGFGPTHEFVDYPKGTYFEAEVVDVKEDVKQLKAGKGGAVFRIQRIVMPRMDRQGSSHELCVDVSATMGKEAPSSLLYNNEAARTQYAGVAANALQLLDHGTGYFNGQAGVEMAMRAWEHYVSKPEEKARSCFIFGTVAKETPCKVELLSDSWF
jgi:hypothetical protein